MSGDFEKLRETIKDYYGTAMTSGFPMAIIELAEVENASDDNRNRKHGIGREKG